MENLILEYRNYLVSEKMRSHNTVNSYVSDLENYVYYLNNFLNIDEVHFIEPEHIKKYLSYLKSLGYSDAAISRALSSIKSFITSSTLNTTGNFFTFLGLVIAEAGLLVIISS